MVVALWWVIVLVVAPDLAYVVGSYICHQRPDRSFWFDGQKMAVCARCTGIYVGAVVGLAIVASTDVTPDRGAVDRTYFWWRMVLIVALMPMVASFGLERLVGLSDNVSRALTAIPLGMAVAGLVGAALRGDFAEAGS